MTVDHMRVVNKPEVDRLDWVDRTEFAASVLTHQADASLADDLAELAAEMTDER